MKAEQSKIRFLSAGGKPKEADKVPERATHCFELSALLDSSENDVETSAVGQLLTCTSSTGFDVINVQLWQTSRQQDRLSGMQKLP